MNDSYASTPQRAKKVLWVFGNAVQDITVEVDVERLSHESGTVHSKINLADKGAEIEANLWLKTQIGGQEFAVQIDLQQAVSTP
jgi:hypothetical protein